MAEPLVLGRDLAAAVLKRPRWTSEDRPEPPPARRLCGQLQPQPLLRRDHPIDAGVRDQRRVAVLEHCLEISENRRVAVEVIDDVSAGVAGAVVTPPSAAP